MKKKAIALVLGLILVMGAAFALVACSCSDGALKAPKGFKEISSNKQLVGSVTFVNYRVIVLNDADWDAMSDADKQKIIDYGFAECRRMAAEIDEPDYNIVGADESGKILFMFDRAKDEVVLYKGGIPDNRLPAPAAPETPTKEQTPATGSDSDKDKDKDKDKGTSASS